MSGPRIPAPGWNTMTKEAFLSWTERLQSMTPSERENALRNFHPRVRVPVERQTPNEADL